MVENVCINISCVLLINKNINQKKKKCRPSVWRQRKSIINFENIICLNVFLYMKFGSIYMYFHFL